MHSLTSLMGLVTDEQTGKVTWAKVCSWCEKERDERGFVQAFARQYHTEVSHGICQTHYAREMEKLKID